MSRSRRKRQLARQNPRVERQTAAPVPPQAVQLKPQGDRAGLQRHKTVGICLLLAVLTVIVYSSLPGHPFLNYDDGAYILFNPNIQQGLTWQTAKWATTTFYEANWHPLTWFVHALDFQLFGPDASGFHLTSLFFHVLNVILLFLLLTRATGAMGRSAVVAALFAVHPLNVESVAWAAELKTLLCTFFFFLALGAYGWYVRKPSVGRYVAAAMLFALGLVSKPMVITLPFVLLLVDFWPLGRIAQWTQQSAKAVSRKPFWSLVLEKAPLFVLSVGSGVVTLLGQRSVGAHKMVLVSLGVRLENALQSYGIYIVKAFWPTSLAPFYPYPLGSIAVWRPVVAGLFLLAVSVLVWKARGDKPYLVTGWLWYLGTLVPVIGLIQVGAQAWADRYAYIPLIGIFVMVVWGLADLADAKVLSLSARLASAAGVLALFSVLGWRQDSYWGSRYDLWTHTLEVTKDNPVAEHNLSMDLMRSQRWEEAVPHLLRASELNPSDVVSLIDLGSVLASQGRHEDAIKEYEKVLQRSSDPSLLLPAYQNLGNEYSKLGDFEKAEANYRQALVISPGEPAVQRGLDIAKREKRIGELSKALVRQPTASGFFEYGQALQEAKRNAEAKEAYERALKLNPRLHQARAALEMLSAQSGKG